MAASIIPFKAPQSPRQHPAVALPTRNDIIGRMCATAFFLDVEQLQVAEIVINAIARGKMRGQGGAA